VSSSDRGCKASEGKVRMGEGSKVPAITMRADGAGRHAQMGKTA
jgi:hypothetical protein